MQPNPSVRSCRCPLIPENWYLQIGIELGIIGLVLYMILVMNVLMFLYKKFPRHKKQDTKNGESSGLHLTSCILFLSLSIAALFLHAFEDSAVAYIIWLLIAACIPVVVRGRAA